MRERNVSRDDGVMNESSSPRKVKEYQAHITIGYKQPPVMELSIKAKSFGEATIRALEMGRQFIQADILNAFSDGMADMVKAVSNGDLEKAEKMYKQMMVNHDDFDIDGLIVTEKNIVQTKVIAEDEANEKMHTEMTAFLKNVAENVAENEEE